MSLRILFADDSMTAQSMGKKILSEAGYEVVAVSNGAAAVKKIAEQKPDIIILDVYMPGYSGLEVCEKVRGSMDTTKTPVLLTVGKMEPYRAEDGNRVRADGVIVKPFEASDLLAIVKKLEERIHRAPARVEQPVLAERAHEPTVALSPSELPVEVPEPAPFASVPAHSTVEVPDHMAGNSAFGDLLASDPLPSIPALSVTSPHVADAMVTPPRTTSIPEYEVPVSWRDRDDDDLITEPAPAVSASVTAPELRSIPVEQVAEPAPPPPPVPEVAVPHVIDPDATAPLGLEPVAPDPGESPVAAPEPLEPTASDSYSSLGGARPLRIPVYQESEPQPPASSYEFMPTSTPAAEDIALPREPELQETAEATTRNTVADAVEPGLMTTRQQFEWEHDHASKDAAELAPVEEEPGIHLQDIPAEIALHAPPPSEAVPEAQSSSVAPPPAPSVERAETRRVSDDDFEARVAAAMAAYRTAGSEPPASPHHEPEPQAAAEAHAAPLAHEPVEYYPPARYEESLVESAAGQAHAESEIVGDAHPPVAETETAAEPEYKIPTFEYRPPISAPEPVPVVEGAAPAEPESTSYATETQPSDIHGAIHAASTPVEESVARAAAAAAGAGADHQAISQAVHRVMERLKPELVEEILRELKSK